jgi:myo-inositol-1(or 4)-monophosphatase
LTTRLTSPDAHQLLDLARAAVLAASQLLLCGLETAPPAVSSKTSPRDLVTDLDRASEALIVARLLADRPDDGILGEEGGERTGTSGVRWVIDPLDGTGNYLHGLPAFAVSVAAELNGVAVAGVVHNPSLRETFTAVRGHGAYRDGRPIAVSSRANLGSALLGTGFSHDLDIRARQAALLCALATRVYDVRHSGSAALDLCSVAAGRLDLYYEGDTRHWDRAAGALIAAEAGAAVCGVDSGSPSDEMIIAGPPPMVDALLALLADHSRPMPGDGPAR